MNPSDAGGGRDAFEVWAHVVIPLLGVIASLLAAVAAVAIPLYILYRQRETDADQFDKQRGIDDVRIKQERERSDTLLQDERAIAEADRVRAARKRATREALEHLAPFVGMNPLQVNVHPYLVALRIRLMLLIDEYPPAHPINDLVGEQHHLGASILRGINEEAESLRVEDSMRASDSESLLDYAELVYTIINPLSGWAAHFTNDLRVIQSGEASEDQIRAKANAVRAELDQMHEKNGWEPAPPPSLRSRPGRSWEA